MKTLKIEKADNGYILHYEDTTDNINEQIVELCLKEFNNSYYGYQSVTLTIEEDY